MLSKAGHFLWRQKSVLALVLLAQLFMLSDQNRALILKVRTKFQQVPSWTAFVRR
jgi:hypothetical protein